MQKNINMKKIILFLGILILSQCQIQVKEISAQKSIGNVSGLNDAKSWTIQADGITYRIFAYGGGASSASLVVINVTKEALEIEKLKLEIKKLQYSGI
jgi:hypothetical protein